MEVHDKLQGAELPEGERAADDGGDTSPSSTPGDVVKLNVGGARFETSRAVLTHVEDSMLGRMFGRCDVMLHADPADGSVFIDRDGEWFGVVLDFLRDLDVPRMRRMIRALSKAALEALAQELDYFGLETAVFGAPPWTDSAAFRPGPEMRRVGPHRAAVFAGGRVFVFGGLTGFSASNETQFLDAQTMAFTPGPDLLKDRWGCAAVQIDSNRVLVAGGRDYHEKAFKSTEILHISTLTFTPGPRMQTARNGCAAVALEARRILVVGGHDGASVLSSTEILNLDTMAFTPGPVMDFSRDGCAAVALDEHRIMVAGGINSGQALKTTEVLNIRTMAFEPGPLMSSARSYCAAVPVDAQHVLVIGGGGYTSPPSLATTELLDVVMMEFEPGPTMLSARSSVAASLFDVSGSPRIFVLGGGTIWRSRGGVLHDEDLIDEGDEDNDETYYFKTTEVLAVEDLRRE